MIQGISYIEFLPNFHFVLFDDDSGFRLFFVWSNRKKNLLVLIVTKGLVIKQRIPTPLDWRLSEMNLIPELINGWIPSDKQLSYLSLLVKLIPVFPDELLNGLLALYSFDLPLTENFIIFELKDWRPEGSQGIVKENNQMTILEVLLKLLEGLYLVANILYENYLRDPADHSEQHLLARNAKLIIENSVNRLLDDLGIYFVLFSRVFHLGDLSYYHSLAAIVIQFYQKEMVAVVNRHSIVLGINYSL